MFDTFTQKVEAWRAALRDGATSKLEKGFCTLLDLELTAANSIQSEADRLQKLTTLKSVASKLDKNLECVPDIKQRIQEVFSDLEGRARKDVFVAAAKSKMSSSEDVRRMKVALDNMRHDMQAGIDLGGEVLDNMKASRWFIAKHAVVMAQGADAAHIDDADTSLALIADIEQLHPQIDEKDPESQLLAKTVGAIKSVLKIRRVLTSGKFEISVLDLVQKLPEQLAIPDNSNNATKAFLESLTKYRDDHQGTWTTSLERMVAEHLAGLIDKVQVATKA